MLLTNSGITIDIKNPADIAHFKKLGYVEVGKPVPEKKVEIATPRTVATSRTVADGTKKETS